ncbi:unnamed protein product [Penicillium salamii]|nr:unnamed protein product [Penicillium salamii]CAG8400213.1 unnamed protein product [Penicillium salamii]
MSALRPFDAWRMFSQSLAISKIVKRTMAYNEDDIVVLESVFWSAWKSERELNRELWMPPKYPDLDMPHDFPGLPTTYKEETLQAWYFYLSEISAWRLEIHAAKESRNFFLRGNGHLEDFAQTADGLMQQLSDWQSSLASEVSITTENETEDMLRLILKSRALYISELVSWPFVYALIHDRIQPNSQTLHKWTARALQCHLHKLKNYRVQFYHRHAGTWLMIRSCARSVLILVGASKLPFAGDLIPKNWRGAVEDALEMFRFWQGHVYELADAIGRIQAISS